MAKTIVTHVNPDLDAITAVWLLTRFAGREFKKSTFEFVAAGERFQEEDNNTVHVDTGLGKFDHHQEDRGREDTCAAKLVYEWLIEDGRIAGQEALRRIVEQVNAIDHFRNFFWYNPADDRYELCLEQVLQGVKYGNGVKDDRELLRLGMLLLDGVLVSLKIKISAEEEIKKGIVFETKWGKSIGVESGNSGVAKLALKMGYNLVVRKDKEIGSVRIKAAPYDEIDLTAALKKLSEADTEANWYFHPSGKMILNGSTKNPRMVPSKLDLSEVITILKAVK